MLTPKFRETNEFSGQSSHSVEFLKLIERKID